MNKTEKKKGLAPVSRYGEAIAGELLLLRPSVTKELCDAAQPSNSNRENCPKMKKDFEKPHVQSARASNSLMGFTLVEMMAVIFIIGLLVAAVAFPVIKYLEKAKVTTTKANMVKIKEAIQMYKMYKSAYPDSLKDLVPEYIEEESKLRDGWKKEFYYSPQGDEGDFDLISGGSDGDINTPEDNVNIWKLDKDE